MLHNEQEKYYFWLAMTPNVGTKTLAKILENYPDPEELFCEAEQGKTLNLGLGEKMTPKITQILHKRADRARFDEQLAYINKKEIEVLTFIGDDYPPMLREIYSPPPFLFVKGHAECLLKDCFAIVGTRHATRRGMENTNNIAKELSENGLVIVSGMASGIDTAAHMGTLSGNGKTIAVLGCGVDVVYPRENERLYEEILENGAIVSDYLPGTPADPRRFPPRNRIITGLSHGVLVVEGSLKSGASITANFALEQNRDVFALPADISLEQGKLPNHLISEGAQIALGAETILAAYNINERNFSEETDEELLPQLDFLQQALYNLLKQGDMTLEQLTEAAERPVPELMEALTMLEILGVVEKMPGNIIRIIR